MSRFVNMFFPTIIFFMCTIFSSALFAKNTINEKKKYERVVVTFEEICGVQQGTILEGTVKGVYSFSMKAASGLYIEIEGEEGGISSHWVGKSGDNFQNDKLASEQTETLLTLAYLNQMKVDFCLLKYTSPAVVSGVRLH